MFDNLNLRSMFTKVFGNVEQPKQVAYFSMLNNTTSFLPYQGTLYDSDICRSCIDAIARNAAKLKARHVRKTADGYMPVHDRLEELLEKRPNEFMSAYDFLYKMVSQLYTDNNAFAFARWNGSQLEGIYPINFSLLELVEHAGEVYCRFSFLNGQKVVLPYSEIIHIRRHFNTKDFYGDDGLQPFRPTLNLMHTMNKGIEQAIKTSAKIRGVLKFTGTLRPEDMEVQRQKFMQAYLESSNNGGIAATDAKCDFVPMECTQQTMNAPEMQLVRDNAYRYFGVNDKIIQANYNEAEWDSFYESVIEPIAIQLSLEFTSKFFTKTEQAHGNEIIFEANRLQYVSAKTKIQLIKELAPLGLLTVNEGREIFNLAPVENGDKRLMSLNYVDADKADEYQLGKADEEGEKSDE